MLIAQISDLHISTAGFKTLGIAPMAENLNCCVIHINKLATRPDLVLVTGDISNSGKIEELTHAKSILDNLFMPYFVVPGNHDNRTDLITVFGASACQQNTDNLINYYINGFAIKLIGIDTKANDNEGGEFTKASYLWLEKQLQIAKGKPVIIFMHHPPVNVGIAETDIDGFIGKELLGSLVEKHNNIAALLCGHIHLSAHTRWHGSLVSTAPSIGMRLCIDFTQQKESQFQLSDPCYQLHNWTKENNLITFDVNANDVQKGHHF